MRDASSIDVATVPKNSREEIRVRLVTYHGVPCIDVRVFSEFGDEADGRKPTKKGLAINVSKLDALLDALNLAQREAERRGLLPAQRGRTAGNGGGA